jgi:hypothetical protein
MRKTLISWALSINSRSVLAAQAREQAKEGGLLNLVARAEQTRLDLILPY